jgi:hypothetical protein
MKLQLYLEGKHSNSWPEITISFNDQILYDGSCIASGWFTFEVESLELNSLKISLKNKNNDDTVLSEFDHHSILRDKKVIIHYIELDEVDLENLIFMGTTDYGQVNTNEITSNGSYMLSFPKDVYGWIISQRINANTDPSEEDLFAFGSWDGKYQYAHMQEQLTELKAKINRL